ncbi:MAG: DUF4362 domain-containing protein [Candidatus Pristimantibacillus sp.]
MKKISIVLIMILMILSGCSDSQVNLISINQLGESENNIDVNVDIVTTDEDQSLDIHSDVLTETRTKNNEDVVWNHKEILNLKKIDEFIENVNQKKQDRLRVQSTTKEGEIIVKELIYNGESIQVIEDGLKKNYDQIIIADRFSDLYKGTFTEYWVQEKNTDNNKELILQIHPNLQN